MIQTDFNESLMISYYVVMMFTDMLMMFYALLYIYFTCVLSPECRQWRAGNDFFNVFDQLWCYYREIVSIYRNWIHWNRYIDGFHRISRNLGICFEIPCIESIIITFSTKHRTDQPRVTPVMTDLTVSSESSEIMYKNRLSQFCLNKHVINTWKYYSFDRKSFFHVLILYQFQAWREIMKIWWCWVVLCQTLTIRNRLGTSCWETWFLIEIHSQF